MMLMFVHQFAFTHLLDDIKEAAPHDCYMSPDSDWVESVQAGLRTVCV